MRRAARSKTASGRGMGDGGGRGMRGREVGEAAESRRGLPGACEGHGGRR